MGIENYTRISAYDGREDDLSGIITGRYPEMMLSGEIDAPPLIWKAMKHFLENTDSPYAIMMEDDCDLVLGTFLELLPGQRFLCMSSRMIMMLFNLQSFARVHIHVQLHKRFVNDFSTAAYMISRHHAEKIVRLHCRKKDKYKLDQGVKPEQLQMI